ncbi:2-oxoglutarate dehydrogenase complex dihydrolipoyllysine-residue succinyltransferase [Zavarzinia compransoris]|uniref:2-oxoglutarate dehydrogenase complex dihydrolipoyllysine-residue succinyltransferase n=1 Tax=Zavarzinia marina TaxID=2911065 RepID=UPI001F48265E|nr:2-oxoglutarate dehydrogenase complex dihydrolipoyllysine-residue succinyltransferase [Zavarzinia marina]MCF4165592.1 2-oxoglutarate dehydrogenase complex dihydrolipoyllysine-residue succinyltransferase [Zavarzinia marina]
MTIELKVPTLGESVTEATIGKWHRKVGEAVKKDETLVELETDKVAVEVNAPESGVLTRIDAAEGDNVVIGQIIGAIDETATAAAPAAKPAAAAPAPVAAPAPAPAPAAPAPVAAPAGATPGPAARKLLSESGLDPATVPATGPGGRVTKGDVLAAVANPPKPAAKVLPPRPEDPREERVKMTRLRKRIAERLKEAQDTAAMLTTFNEVDMTNLMEARNQYKELFEKKHGVKMGFMSFFVKAAVQALKEVPAVNAEIYGDEIVYKNYYDISVAVSSPSGLVVPVVRDADKLGFHEIEKEIARLGAKARDGKLAIEDMQGGTFTISNGGVFGSLMSTPIINPPQSAILGMHKIQDRPMVVNKQIVSRPMMYLAVSYDHRLIDGREAVTFLVRIKEAIEDPARLLFGV